MESLEKSGVLGPCIVLIMSLFPSKVILTSKIFFTDFERNVIKAAADLQNTTKKPISFHCGRSWESPFEIMRVFLEAGGHAEGTVMSHLDRKCYLRIPLNWQNFISLTNIMVLGTLSEDEHLLEFAKLNAYNQFDLFGTECSYYQFNEEQDMPSDAQRIQKIRLLIENGYSEKILMSHDIHTKHRLVPII